MRGLIGAVAAIVMLLAGCSSSSKGSPPVTGPTGLTSVDVPVDQYGDPLGNGGGQPDMYVQTYPVGYGDITCKQWLEDMTGDQKFVASHDMIVALNAYDTSDAFATSFVADIDKGCAPDPDIKMNQIAAGIATLATGDFPN